MTDKKLERIDLSALSPKNLVYLTQFVAEVGTKQPPLPTTDEPPHVFKQGATDRVVVMLPGSFMWLSYLSDFVAGFSNVIGEPSPTIIGANYPSRNSAYSESQIDQFELIDYVASIMRFLARNATGRKVTLIGHSLGTIIAQMALLAWLTAEEQTYTLDSVVILGGGPPKLTWIDYVESLSRLNTLTTVMQMVNQPQKFVDSGSMAITVGGKEVFDQMLRDHLIHTESRQVMRQSFLQSNHSFIPAPLIANYGIKALVVGGSKDLFVRVGAIRRGFAQWGGDSLLLPLEHTELVFGANGVKTGAQVAAWMRKSIT